MVQTDRVTTRKLFKDILTKILKKLKRDARIRKFKKNNASEQ
jgi:heme exporter protein D